MDYIHKEIILTIDYNKYLFSQLTSILNLIKYKNPQYCILEIDILYLKVKELIDTAPNDD